LFILRATLQSHRYDDAAERGEEVVAVVEETKKRG
jgi:hypothetical protein